MDVTANPIFFLTVPDRKPRTECGCQPVTFINSWAVTPPGRLSNSSTWSVLLPSRTPGGFLSAFGRFLGWGGLLGRLALLLRNVGALWRNTRLFCGFRLLARRRVRASAGFFRNRFTHVFSLSGDYRVDNIHHSVRKELQENSPSPLDFD